MLRELGVGDMYCGNGVGMDRQILRRRLGIGINYCTRAALYRRERDVTQIPEVVYQHSHTHPIGLSSVNLSRACYT